jgi:anti-sigma factor ChrR (cupin superfamily)
MNDEVFSELPEAVRLLAEGVAPVTPSPGLKERLMARVAQFEELRPEADVRHGEGEWEAGEFPGVAIKPLFTDTQKKTMTLLMRMDPGARYPAHKHHGAEQCMVLKGDVRWGDLVYEEGDFLVMGRGSHHPEITTVHGNLLLLVSGGLELVHA